MIPYSIVLPLPPSSGRSIDFTSEVKLSIKLQKIPNLKGKLWVVARIFPRDKRNINEAVLRKNLMNALQHAGVYDNDSQIDDLQIKRGMVIKGGKCEVLIGELEK